MTDSLKQRLAMGLVTAAFLGLAWLGASGGLNDLGQARGALQRTQAVSQLGYALASLAVLALVWRRSPHLRAGLLGWTALFGTAAALAPPAWAEASWVAGAQALLVALVIAWALAWLARRAAAGSPTPPDVSR